MTCHVDTSTVVLTCLLLLCKVLAAVLSSVLSSSYLGLWLCTQPQEGADASPLSSAVLVLAWSLERLKMTSVCLLATPNDSQITLLPSAGYLVRSVFHILFSQLWSAPNKHTHFLFQWLAAGWQMVCWCVEVGKCKGHMYMPQQSLLQVIQMNLSELLLSRLLT